MNLRKVFWNSILQIAQRDKNVIVMVGDLGYSYYEEFAKTLPKQFINAGIAEQNMVSMACGMAMEGKKPYVYSGSLFLVTKALEQIRNDVCYQNKNVKLVATGAADFLGFTHIRKPENEDVKILDHLPNLKIYASKTEKECIKAIKESYSQKGPAYIVL